MKQLVCAAALLIALYQPPAAAREFTVLGQGNLSCGTWVAEHTKNSMSSAAQDSWLVGYVTAVNKYALTNAPDVSAGTDLPGMSAWMTNYCRANPLDTVSKATGRLVIELLKRSGAF